MRSLGIERSLPEVRVRAFAERGGWLARGARFVRGECAGWRFAEAAWMFFCVATITGLSLWWHETPVMILAAVSGMMYTLLAGKGKISCYLFGLINTPLYAYAAWQHRYYGDVALNVYYFLMMFPGLILWRRHRDMQRAGEVRKRCLPSEERWLWAGGAAAAIAAMYFVLSCLGGARPLCDAATNVFSVAAMLLTVRRCAEQWPLWIAVNLIEVFMWFNASGPGQISILLMWTLFAINGCVLCFCWYRDLSDDLRPTH